MTDLGLDASQETRITVMQLKIERLEEKQDELRERLKVVEKWVIGAAAVLAAGTTVIGFAVRNNTKQTLYATISPSKFKIDHAETENTRSTAQGSLKIKV